VDLFTEDATYSISVREAVQQREEASTPLPRATPPLVDEGRTFLATRVKRLETHLAHAEQPPSLTRHLITNVLVHSGSSKEVHVSSNFHVYQARVDVSEHVFYGARNDVLRSLGGEWRIARRQVVLDTSLLPRTLTVFF
jgi:3-phenylpropionate/cinnamic acid dioxygenase small subunit